jgi:hypothetical protein
MKPQWIIENFTKEESFLDLEKEVRAQGYDVQTIKGDFLKADLADYRDTCVIFNGSIEMCKIAKEVLSAQGCSPIIYCDWEKYLCTSYYPHFSEHVFNDNYVLVPMIEFQRRLYQFYGIFGKQELIFVRPNNGDKTFKAELLDIQDAPKFFEELDQYKHDLVLLSTPKNIIGEWRFVCTAEKEILAVSSYRYQGVLTRIPSAPHGANEKCKELLEIGYYPDSVFCIDIVQDSDGNFWMMELTSFSSAGLYSARKENIVRRVSEIAMKDYEKSNLQSRLNRL